ncbi:MAG: hypothetical protein BWZ01_03074 [Deltaproteobacteria bacterium ADurb.BinA179]|nr:MAG: hypothetical protein BWZ01_03074 [Deltaproteobacteria bacterium ADurb.BinA179]
MQMMMVQGLESKLFSPSPGWNTIVIAAKPAPRRIAD